MNSRKLAWRLFRYQKSMVAKLVNNIDFHDGIVAKDQESVILPGGYAARIQMYEYINATILENAGIDFLEFGVYKGDSLRSWLGLNTNPRSKFYGFDSFTGLPEQWGKNPKGTFDVGGSIPEIDDDRASFVVGLFQETLTTFLESYGPEQRLVVHIDSDLYSAALYCLTKLDRFLVRDSIIIFDEFGDLENEYAAFRDYILSYNREYSIICRAPDYSRVIVKMT